MRKSRILIVAALLVFITGSSLSSIRPTSALSGSDWHASNIIQDGIFTNTGTMSTADIQNFLNSKNPNCDTLGQQPSEYGGGTRAQYGAAHNNPAPFICLKDYYENVSTHANNLSGNPIPSGAVSAAQIIHDYSQQYQVNPQALLVLLQKEQGLVTDEWPWLYQYRTAAGYGCPDTAACDSTYYGFANQVKWASTMFHAILTNNPNWYTPYVTGNNYVQWNPQSSCGGSNVNIENNSTAALYSYTPYQPNPAALNNLDGLGDSCSAYGNRNFWRYFNRWFGPTTVSGRVSSIIYDATTDAQGEAAKVGFYLNQAPQQPVTVLLHVSNPAVAGLVGTDRVVIYPSTWNRPDLNTVTLYGKNDGSNQSENYNLITDEVASYDPQFDLLTGADVGDPNLINMAGDLTVYRVFSSATGKHYYTSRQNEYAYYRSIGYTDEGAVFNSCRSGEQDIVRLKRGSTTFNVSLNSSEYNSAIAAGYYPDAPQFSVSRGATVPVYRLHSASSDDYFYTLSAAERDNAVASYGYTYEGVGFNTCRANEQPVFRMLGPDGSSHFYTASPDERDTAGAHGYRHEGVGFYTESSNANLPVYRLVNTSTRTYFYTTATQERDAAVQNGYTLEGVGFYLEDTQATLPVYRLLNAAQHSYFYTISDTEKNAATQLGYKLEGTAFNLKP